MSVHYSVYTGRTDFGACWAPTHEMPETSAVIAKRPAPLRKEGQAVIQSHVRTASVPRARCVRRIRTPNEHKSDHFHCEGGEVCERCVVHVDVEYAEADVERGLRGFQFERNKSGMCPITYLVERACRIPIIKNLTTCGLC